VAVDPTAIAYGSMLSIPGFMNRVRADDTGGTMRKAWRNKKEYHLDLRFTSHQKALEWGVKQLKVEVWQKVSPQQTTSKE